jgi:hypothetical protein
MVGNNKIYYCPLKIIIEQYGSEWMVADWALLAASAIPTISSD